MASGLMGLVGLVCFLNGNGLAIMHLLFGCGIGLIFHLGWFRDDAPAFGLYNASIYPWSFVIWAYLSVARSYHSAIADHVEGHSEMLLQERMFDLPLVLCCMGTHICRALIPQCNA